MKKFLIALLLILVIILAGFGSYYISYNLNDKPDDSKLKEKMCKIFYLDDANTEKTTLTYYSKKIDLTVPVIDQVKELLNISKRGHDNGYSPFPMYADVLSVEVTNNIANISLNDQFFVLQANNDKMKDIAVDCIVNTVMQLRDVHGVKITKSGKEVEKFGDRNLKEVLKDSSELYEINAHVDEKIPMYLKKMIFTNKDKKQVFESTPKTWESKEAKIKDIAENEADYTVTYNVTEKNIVKRKTVTNTSEEVYKITNEGLFIDDVKYLDKSLYIGNTWTVENFKPLIDSLSSKSPYKATFKVSDVIYREVDKKILKEYDIEITVPDLVTKTGTTYVENVTFRENSGIYKRNTIDPTSAVHSRLDVNMKEEN